jgi:hypothetical protein
MAKNRFTDDQKIKYFLRSLKVLGAVAFVGLNGFLFYNYVTANQAGRKRAE